MRTIVVYTVLLMLLLSGCQVTVPQKVNQNVSGALQTTNVIRLEIAIPPEIMASFNTTCESKCKDDADFETCKTNCQAEQQTNYTNTLLGFLTTLQSTFLTKGTNQ